MKHIGMGFLAVAGTFFLSACVNEADRSSIQSYADRAGISYSEAQSSIKIVQLALKNLKFYSGPVNGVPSASVNAALQKYVEAERAKKGKNTTGAPTSEEIQQLISSYEAFLKAIASGDKSSAGSFGFDASNVSSSDMSTASQNSTTLREFTTSNGAFVSGVIYGPDGTATTYTDQQAYDAAAAQQDAGTVY